MLHPSIPTAHSLTQLLLQELEQHPTRPTPTERIYENILVRVLLHETDVTPLMG